MENDYEINADLHDLMEEVISENKEFEHLANVDIACLECAKSKKSNGKIYYGDCTKVTDKMKAVANCDFLITFYPEGMELSPEIQYRLMYHELLHVGYDPESGKCSIVPHDLEDFKAVIDRWGTDWIYDSEDL